MTVGRSDLQRNAWIQLGKRFQLRFDERSSSVTCLKFGITIWEIRSPYISQMNYISYWYNDITNRMLLCDNYGLNVLLIKLEPGEITASERLNRSIDDDAGLFRNEFIDLPDGCLLVYESGLLSFDSAGTMRWHIGHQYIDRIFIGVHDECAWYESEFEGKWGYRLSDGSRVTPTS